MTLTGKPRCLTLLISSYGAADQPTARLHVGIFPAVPPSVVLPSAASSVFKPKLQEEALESRESWAPREVSKRVAA